MQPPCGQRATKVVVLATGGTIAGRLVAPGGRAYRSAELSAKELLDAVPGVPDGAGTDGDVEAEQLAQIDSKDMTHALWRALALRCQHHLARPEVTGVVVTHGTDTMEETAYFLHGVLGSLAQLHGPAGKPVVLTGAMRPSDAPDADGPQNLGDALTLARHGKVHGVLVAMAGQVHDPVHVRKAHATRLDAFTSGDQGPLAVMEHGAIRLLARGMSERAPSQSHGKLAPSLLPPAQGWPRVALVMSHAGADSAVVDALVGVGVQGIVVAATGHGTVHAALEAGLRRAVDAGIAVEVATRCLEPAVMDTHAEGEWPMATHGSPVKARIALMLKLLAAQSH